jgi:lipopolysaccharide export system permease protein
LGLGLAFFLIYYLMLSAGQVFGEAGVYPPVIGMWAPNVVMGGLGLFLVVRTATDRPVKVDSMIAHVRKKIRQILRTHEN